MHKWRVIIFTQNGDQDIEQNGVRTALITRLEMLLIDVTECLSTELDDVIDRIRDFSEDLYRCHVIQYRENNYAPFCTVFAPFGASAQLHHGIVLAKCTIVGKY